MYCGSCEAKDLFKAEFSLFLVKQKLDNDDEFKSIEQKPYQEIRQFMNTKYVKVRKLITQANRHASFKEGIDVKSDSITNLNVCAKKEMSSLQIWISLNH